MIRKVFFALALGVLVAADVASDQAKTETPTPEQPKTQEAPASDPKPKTDAGEQKGPEMKKNEIPKNVSYMKPPGDENNYYDPNQPKPYVPAELTPEEQEKFKIAPDGIPYRFPQIWALSAREPDNPWNDNVLKEMHSMVNDWSNANTYLSDKEFPETHQPIRVSEEMYRKIVYETDTEATPWLIVFLKTTRSQPQFYHSDYTMNSMKILGDYYRGKVRFGYVNVVRDEMLKETFGVKTVPQNFFIKGNMIYEMGALQVQFRAIQKFIDEEEWKQPPGGAKVYQAFSLPWIIPKWFLPVKYAEDFMVKLYINKCRFNCAYWLRQHNNPFDGKPLYEISPYVDQYFKMRGTPQAYIFWVTVTSLGVIVIYIVYKLLSCMCRCFCGKKAKTEPEKKKTD